MATWHQWLRWVESTAPAVALREASWIYPIVETFHIIGLVGLVGAAAMFDMRLLGMSGQLPVDRLAGHLLPWSRFSLIVVVPSGVLLFISAATETWANPAFRLKLLLIAAAGVNAYVFHRRTFCSVGEGNHGSTPAAAKLSAVVSLVLWTGVIAAGRLIAYV